MRHDRRWVGRLEQEDQRLKKHYGRWMDIVRSLELESFILTKLTKPFVPVNLVGPQVSLPLWWVPAVRWRNHYYARTVHGRWMSFVDLVDQAAPRAPWRWTTARPRKGTTRQWKPVRRGLRGFTGSAEV